MIDSLIIEILRSYTHTEKRKNEMFDTYMFTIKGMLKELTQLVSEPIGMTNFTYNILRMAYMNPEFQNSVDNGIENYAEKVGLEKHPGTYPKSLDYSFDELKNLFSQENIG